MDNSGPTAKCRDLNDSPVSSTGAVAKSAAIVSPRKIVNLFPGNIGNLSPWELAIFFGVGEHLPADCEEYREYPSCGRYPQSFSVAGVGSDAA